MRSAAFVAATPVAHLALPLRWIAKPPFVLCLVLWRGPKNQEGFEGTLQTQVCLGSDVRRPSDHLAGELADEGGTGLETVGQIDPATPVPDMRCLLANILLA